MGVVSSLSGMEPSAVSPKKFQLKSQSKNVNTPKLLFDVCPCVYVGGIVQITWANRPSRLGEPSNEVGRTVPQVGRTVQVGRKGGWANWRLGETSFYPPGWWCFIFLLPYPWKWMQLLSNLNLFSETCIEQTTLGSVFTFLKRCGQANRKWYDLIFINDSL